MHLRRLIWLLLVLASCSGREIALSPAEYYDLGRYARLDGDWSAAVGYFENALSVAERIGDNYYRGYACQQLAAMWILAGENSIALSYSITAVAALEACGETAGALLSRLDSAALESAAPTPSRALRTRPPGGQ